MRFIRLVLLAAAMLAVCSACWAEEAYSDRDLIDFGYREMVSGFGSDEALSVRSCYAISLPEDDQGVPEVVVDAYGGYDRILLVEYGCCSIQPIVEGRFVCVGASADETLCILPTPFDLLAKTYDLTAFDNVSIQRVD